MRMNQLYNSENWLFGDYKLMVKKLGGYHEQFEPAVYDYWLDNCWTLDRHKQIIETLSRFVGSGEFCLGSQMRNNA